MSPRRLFLGLVYAAALSAFATTGCAVENDADSAEDQADIQAGSVLGEVAAVKRQNSTDYMMGAKLKTILETMGLQRGAPKPKEGEAKCKPVSGIDFYNAAGDVVGSATYGCDINDTTNTAATLRIKDKSYLIKIKDVEEIRLAAQEPSTVGEILFGANRATIGRVGDQNPVEVKKIDKVIGALKADELPDFKAPGNRCVPSRLITLYRNDQKLGIVALNCADDARGVVPGALTPLTPRYNSLVGKISVNATDIFAAEKAAK